MSATEAESSRQEGTEEVSTAALSTSEEVGFEASARPVSGEHAPEAAGAAQPSASPQEGEGGLQELQSSGGAPSATGLSGTTVAALAGGAAGRAAGQPSRGPPDSSPSAQSSDESQSTESEEAGVKSPRHEIADASKAAASRSPSSAASPRPNKVATPHAPPRAKKSSPSGPSGAIASDAAKVLVRLRLAPLPPPPPSGRGRTRNCWQPLGGGKYAMVLTRQHFPGRIILPSRSAADVGAEIFGKEWCESVAAMSDDLSSKARQATLREVDHGRDWGVNYRIFHKTPGQPIYLSGGVAKLFSARGAAPYWVVTLAPIGPGVAEVAVLPPRAKLATTVLAQLGFADELPALPLPPTRPASPLPAKREREEDPDSPQNEDEEVAVASMRSLSMAVVPERTRSPDAQEVDTKGCAAAAPPRRRSTSPEVRDEIGQQHDRLSPPRAKVDRRESTTSSGRAASVREASEQASEAPGPGTPAKPEPQAEASKPPTPGLAGEPKGTSVDRQAPLLSSSTLEQVPLAAEVPGSNVHAGAGAGADADADANADANARSNAGANAGAPSASSRGSEATENSGQRSPPLSHSSPASLAGGEAAPLRETTQTPPPEVSSKPTSTEPPVADLPVLTEPAWPDGKDALTATPAAPSPARKGRFDPTDDAFLTREQRAAKRAAAMQERLYRDDEGPLEPPRSRSLRHRRKSGAFGDARASRSISRPAAGALSPAPRVETIGSRPGSFSEIKDFDKIPTDTWKMLLPLSRAPDEGPSTPSSQAGASPAVAAATSIVAGEKGEPLAAQRRDTERSLDAAHGDESVRASPMAVDL